jgi:hypothetical protein
VYTHRFFTGRRDSARQIEEQPQRISYSGDFLEHQSVFNCDGHRAKRSGEEIDVLGRK